MPDAPTVRVVCPMDHLSINAPTECPLCHAIDGRSPRKYDATLADPAAAAALAREPVLRAFFERFISTGVWNYYDPDWGDVQDEAVKAGLLVQLPHPQPCGIEDCPCEGEAEYLYHFAWSAGARAAQETARE